MNISNFYTRKLREIGIFFNIDFFYIWEVSFILYLISFLEYFCF